jgi:hypothetical protein
MNSEFAIHQAKALAARSAGTNEVDGQNAEGTHHPQIDAKERVRRTYRFALAREPDNDEMSAALDFVDPESFETLQKPGEAMDRWIELAQVLLLCNEFAFVD